MEKRRRRMCVVKRERVRTPGTLKKKFGGEEQNLFGGNESSIPRVRNGYSVHLK